MKTISGREINNSKRTFTRYRTGAMNKQDFESCLNNTANDWQVFLRMNDNYSKVK